MEQEGIGGFFGEPAFDVDDLLRTTPGEHRRDRRARALGRDEGLGCSAFLLWMLAQLYEALPEVGDEPKLAFFFDEAHLLFDDASDALMEQIELTRAADALEGRGRVLRDAGPDGRAVLGALATREPDPARAPGVHAAGRRRPAQDRAHVPEDGALRRRGRSRRSASARRSSRCSHRRAFPSPLAATLVIPPDSRMSPADPRCSSGS